jgi:hypothetical protein
MKTNLLMMTALMAQTMVAETLANGLEVQIPAGWQMTRTEKGAVVMPPDAIAGSEAYVVAMLPSGTDLRSLVKGTPTAAPRMFQAAGGRGTVYSYGFIEEGREGNLELYVVPLKSGNIAGLMAAGLRYLLTGRSAAVMAMAASLREAAAAPAPAPAAISATSLTAGTGLARQWTTRLAGKKLMQFSSYSSGSSGGMSSQRTLALGTDGSYWFRSSSSVAIYVPGATGTSAGRNGQEGRWRIYEEGGHVILELAPANGDRELITLTMDGTKTLLNGRRWLVGD